MRITLRIVAAALAFAVTLCASDRLRAQEDFVREVIEEKTHWDAAALERALLEARSGRLPTAAEADAARRDADAADTAAPGESVVSNGTSPESEVHAAINPADSNNIIVSPIDIGSITTGLICPIYYTKNFGRTWQRSVFKTTPLGFTGLVSGGGDPVIAFDNDGVAYIIWISVYRPVIGSDSTHFGLYWAYSDDGGATWRQAALDEVHVGRYGRMTPSEVVDKEWIAVDRSSTPRRNTIYVAYVNAVSNGTGQRIVVRAMRPGTRQFVQQSTDVSTAAFRFVQFASIDVDLDAVVHVSFFGSLDNSHYGLYYASSADGGESFSAPVLISAVHAPKFSGDATYNSIPGITSRRMYPCPHIAVDKTNGPNRGNLYAVWTADGTTSDLRNGLDVYFSRSADRGATWSKPALVNDDPRGVLRHQHYPSITVNSDGVVVVSFYDRRTDARNYTTNYMVACSFDGGLTFARNVVASAQPTDFSTVGSRNSQFGIGEYTQVVATNNYAIPVWTDGRTGDGDLNILSAFVPISPESESGVERVGSVTTRLELTGAGVRGDAVEMTFRLDVPGRASARLSDVSGRITAEVPERDMEAGVHTIRIPAAGLPSGRYMAQLTTTVGNAAQAVLLVR